MIRPSIEYGEHHMVLSSTCDLERMQGTSLAINFLEHAEDARLDEWQSPLDYPAGDDSDCRIPTKNPASRGKSLKGGLPQEVISRWREGGNPKGCTRKERRRKTLTLLENIALI